MLEYLSPSLLSILDPSSPRIKWRTNYKAFEITDAGRLLYTSIGTSTVPYRGGKWVAISFSPDVDYLVRGLADDGCQYRYVCDNDPDRVNREESQELTDFLVL